MGPPVLALALVPPARSRRNPFLASFVRNVPEAEDEEVGQSTTDAAARLDVARSHADDPTRALGPGRRQAG